jgi:hypothetical protein
MKKGYTLALVVVAILVAASAVLNGMLVFGFLKARNLALNIVSDARGLVNDAADDTLSYEVEVNQSIPIQTTVPFNQEITVPFRSALPISTVVSIPIKAGILGTFDIDVPIRTVVPVNVEVTVPVSQTVHISTTVPVNLAVPIDIPMAETPLVAYLPQIVSLLNRVEVLLQNPLAAVTE